MREKPGTGVGVADYSRETRNGCGVTGDTIETRKRRVDGW